MGLSVGIDFGTSTTVAAAYRDGKPTVIKNTDGQDVTPSCVAFPPSGEVAIGIDAKRRRVIDPVNSLYSVKRILGLSSVQSEFRDFQANYPFEIEVDADDQPRFVTRAGKHSPTDIATHLLRHVRQSPEIEGEAVANATLTVPTVFTPEQRDALKEAAAVAGFKNIKIIDEPSAAALAYLEGNDDDQVVVIYDLGGGTFDLTVMHWSGAEYQVLGVGGDVYSDFEVLGVGGDPYLGGDDVDLSCAQWVRDRVLEDHRWDVRSSDVSFQKLLLSCETAKQLLSLTDTQSIDLTSIDEVLRDKNIELTQADVQRLCSDLVRRTFIICDEALAQASIGVDKVSSVILSGGGCHMPVIQEGVARYFKTKPKCLVEPDRAVAIGAALHAGREAHG